MHLDKRIQISYIYFVFQSSLKSVLILDKESNMSSEISLKNLEKNVFQRSIQDGTIDIQIGGYFLMFATVPLLSTYLGDFWASAVFLPIWAALYFVMRSIRNNFVKPRLGVVKYGSYRKTRLKKMTTMK